MPLSPSHRVVLIKEISDRLGTEDYPLIDATLKQFSLPWSDQWEGNKNSYVLSMVAEAPDEVLVDLAQHVGFSFEMAPAVRIDPPFWRKGMLRVFVSHLATYRVFAGELQTALLDFGISGFVAYNDIEPTQEWQTQIETALATCDALIALLHSDFHASNWTDQEIGFAMGKESPYLQCAWAKFPMASLADFRAFNGDNKAAVALAREIFDAFRRNKQTQLRIGQVLVGLFEESNSFAEAKTRIGYLEELSSWERSFSTRIRSAVKSNSQIYESYGVPARAGALVQKWAKSGL